MADRTGWTPEAIRGSTVVQLLCAAVERPPGEAGPKSSWDQMKAALEAQAAEAAAWSGAPVESSSSE